LAASPPDFADPDGNTWVLQEIGYRTRAAGSPAAPRSPHRSPRNRRR